MAADPEHGYVSRGGLKLEHALLSFEIDVTGLSCVDLGASTGGFTDCLLQNGAASVCSVDTAYGVFAWKLRQDERVCVIERSNALHTEQPEHIKDAGGVDLAVIDLGWTPQKLALPAAMNWLKPGGQVLTLIKPHYEPALQSAEATEPQDHTEPPRKQSAPKSQRKHSKDAVLSDTQALAVTERVLATLPGLGFEVLGNVQSPIRGSKNKRTGNLEWIAWLRRDA